jgi:segregation and condensation protein B
MHAEQLLSTELPLTARIEALLFVAPGTVTTSQLAAALDVSSQAVEAALGELEAQYNQRGIRLQSHRGRVQLTTAPEAAPLVEHFLGLEATSRLTRAALEALSIVAFQQPATRPQIDAVRGVNSDAVLKGLLGKGLVQEVGRAETPGRPILYATTPEFLQHFGLGSLDELPRLAEDEPGNGDPEQSAGAPAEVSEEEAPGPEDDLTGEA